jgi:hypothetical protein
MCENIDINNKNLTHPFKCIGNCRKGFFSNQYGACVDINECQTTNPCPLDSKCVNTLGGFSCECRSGFQYVNNSCNRKIFLTHKLFLFVFKMLSLT